MSLSRRDVLLGAGATALGLAAGSMGEARLFGAPRPSRSGAWGLEKEAWNLSVCGGCPAGCSVRIRTVGERAVGIVGNPLCPVSRGGLCGRGAAQIEAIYDPDRFLGPARRVGSRGAGGWEPATWDEALGSVATRIQELRRGGRVHRIGVMLGAERGALTAVTERLLWALGSPHLYHAAGLRDPGAGPAASLTMGLSNPWSYDLSSTDYLLSFDTPLLEGWLSPTWVARVYGAARARTGDPIRLVHVSARMSETAGRADEWVPVKAGTEGTLALGLAHVLLKEERLDAHFIERWTTGFRAWKDGDGADHTGLADVLSYAYSPRIVSDATGVPVPTILRLAREFAAAARPLALGERLGISAGVFGLAAVNVLNAMRGRIGVRGGLLPARLAPVRSLGEGSDPRPKAGVPSLTGPSTMPVAGANIWAALGAESARGGEPAFDLLILQDGAALDGLVPGGAAAGALEKVPMVVSLATALDRSTMVADLVLPATTHYEQFNDIEPQPFDGRPYLAVSGPAMSPVVDGRPPVDVLLDLSRRLGEETAAALPFADSEAVIRHRVGGLFEARRGLPYDSPFQSDWARQMEEAGLWASRASSEAEFEEMVFERGGWGDPVVHYGNPGAALPGESGRFEFHGDAARRRARAGSMLFPGEDTDDAWLPHPEGVSESAEGEGGFTLIATCLRSFVGGGSPNLPSLIEQSGPQRRGAFEPWGEFNPEDARRERIEEGDTVALVSRNGTVAVVVHLNPGIPPGAVAVPLGSPALGGGRWTRKWRGAAEQLIGEAPGALVGVQLAGGTRVRLDRAVRRTT